MSDYKRNLLSMNYLSCPFDKHIVHTLYSILHPYIKYIGISKYKMFADLQWVQLLIKYHYIQKVESEKNDYAKFFKSSITVYTKYIRTKAAFESNDYIQWKEVYTHSRKMLCILLLCQL